MPGRAQTNVWTSPGDGFWDNGRSWSLRTPPSSGQSIFFTNDLSKTILLDAVSVGVAPGSTSISNLVISAPTGSTNTLRVQNPGPGTVLRVGSDLVVGAGGQILLSNAQVSLDGGRSNQFVIDGSVKFDGGGFTASNALVTVGSTGTGFLTQTAATSSGRVMTLGDVAGSFGRVDLQGGQMGFGVLTVGNAGAAIFNQTGGVNGFSGGELLMGFSARGSGIYNLNGGQMGGAGETIGIRGAGSFNQSGGTNTPGDILLGYYPGATGIYNLSAGSLKAGSIEIGSAGGGQMNQSGGLLQAGTLQLGVQSGASGVYGMTAGTLVATNLLLASSPGATGAFSFSNGFISANTETVGYGGMADFSQSGGQNSSHTMGVGTRGGPSTYTLTAGVLTGNSLSLGTTGNGFLNQSGGTVNFGQVTAGSGGTYNLSGGTLSAQSLSTGLSFSQSGGTISTSTLNVGNGIFSTSGGTIGSSSLQVVSGGTFTQSGARVAVGSFVVESGSSYNFDGGFLSSTQSQISGSFHHSGGTNAVAGPIYLSSTYTFSGGLATGTVATVDFNSGSVNQSGGTARFSILNMPRTYQFSGGEVSVGILNVGNSDRVGKATPVAQFGQFGGNATNTILNIGIGADTLGGYGLGGGILQSSNVLIGQGAGSFGALQQTGSLTGFNISGAMVLGRDFNASGTYTLSGGTASAGSILLGDAGRGILEQSGGALAVAGDLVMGNARLSIGSFKLDGGTFSTRNGMVGVSGSGTFAQTAGVAGFSNLVLAAQSSATGTYTLSGGGLTSGTVLVGSNGAGFFYQTGGTNSGSYLSLGGSTNGTASYNLSSGQLNYRVLTVGSNGVGVLNQTGGNVGAVGQELALASATTSVGTYNFTNGTLTTLGEWVGLRGRGSFIQNDGTNSSASLSLGYYLGSTGSYALVSGLVATPAVDAGYHGSGRWTQTGGQLQTRDFNAGVRGGTGWIDLNGGSILTTNFVLGTDAGSTGLVTIASGFLSADGEILGLRGRGQVVQSGGTNRTRSLVLGTNVASFGSYTLSGGLLSASNLNVGLSGSALFSGLGGSLSVGTLSLGFGGVFSNSSMDAAMVNLSVIGSGYLTGGAGSRFLVERSFLDTSVRATEWDTAASALVFKAGASHLLQLPGADRGPSLAGFTANFAWNTLELGTGGALTLQDGNAAAGGAMYVRKLLLDGGLAQVAAITGNGFRIFYDPADSANSYLGGGSFSLVNGGSIAPVTSSLRVRAIGVDASLHATVDFDHQPGQACKILYSTDCKTWNEISAPSLQLMGEGLARWVDAEEISGQRFYRVVVAGAPPGE